MGLISLLANFHNWIKVYSVHERANLRAVEKMEGEALPERSGSKTWSIDMDVQELGNKSTDTVELGETCDSANHPVRKKSIDRYKDPEKRIKYKAEWNRKNYPKVAEKRRQYAREYYHANSYRVLKQKAERKLKEPESIRATERATRERNREKIRAKQKEWRKNNPEAFRKLQRDYRQRRNALNKRRRSENPTRKLAENSRSRICHILKREKVTKSVGTFKFIGCTAEFFRSFLEHQFTPEMNWKNYGVFWNVDHVIPISKFDLHDADQLRTAFHYSNCRPLEAEKNSEKNDTLPGPHQPALL